MLNFLGQNIDIKQLSNFKTKAKAKYYFEINSLDDLDKLRQVFEFIRGNNLKYLIVSSGTNLLFAFDIFDGVIIKNNLKGFKFEDNILTLKSAEIISDIAEKVENNFNNKIWHRFIGLPGSVGGAVFGNAGCFGLETMNNFVKCSLFDIDTGDLKTILKKDMKFEYRTSILKKTGKYLLLEAVFDLSFVEEKYSSDKDVIDFRQNKQPEGNSCGSFFKNPSGDSAGRMIEEVGLKGYKIGGAFFSPMHANFLMSDGNAEYRDLLLLRELAITKVKEEFEIDLETEVRIIY